MNFNGGSGTPSVTDFTGSVTVTGDLKVSGTSLFGDGSDSAPSISFIAEPTTGFERSAPGEVSFVTSGAKRIKLSTSGLTTPSLTVNGTTTTGSLTVLGSISTTGSTMTGTTTINPDLFVIRDGSIGRDLHITGVTTTQGLLSAQGNISTPAINTDFITTFNLVVVNTTSLQGSVSAGTNSLTVGSITSTGPLTVGTNSITSGSLSSGTLTLSSQPLLYLTSVATPQNLVTGTETVFTGWDTTEYSTFGFNLVSATSLTVLNSGVYDIVLQMGFGTVGSGRCFATVYVNGVTTDRVCMGGGQQGSAAPNMINCSGRRKLNANDVLTVSCIEYTGVNTTCGTIDSSHVAKWQVTRMF